MKGQLTYSIAHFKSHLSALLKDAARGDELIITEHNKPVAKVVAFKRIPPLPKFDSAPLLRLEPIALKRGAPTSAELIGKLRDEES